MNDTLKALLTSGPLWSAIIAAVVGTILYFNPAFPRELLALYVALFVAVLTAIGITGVVGVVPAVREARAERALNAEAASRSPVKGPDRVLYPGQLAFETCVVVMGGSGPDGGALGNWPNQIPSVKAKWAAAEAAVKGTQGVG